MIVPTAVRPGTTHLGDGCPCGHTHTPAPPVLKGPAHRLASNVGYIVTDGRLYQQVTHVALHVDVDMEVIETVQVVRTVGTIERPAA